MTKLDFQYKEDGHLRELISSDINTTDWNDIMVRISDLELELWVNNVLEDTDTAGDEVRNE